MSEWSCFIVDSALSNGRALWQPASPSVPGKQSTDTGLPVSGTSYNYLLLRKEILNCSVRTTGLAIPSFPLCSLNEKRLLLWGRGKSGLGSYKIQSEYQLYRLCVNWDKLLCISEAQFPFLQNENNKFYLARMLGGLNKMRYLKLLVPSRILISEHSYNKNI